MQWLYALITACICFFLIQSMEKKKDDKNDNKKYSKKIIMFFLIVLIFQVLFYLLDIGKRMKRLGNKNIEGNGDGDGDGDGEGDGDIMRGGEKVTQLTPEEHATIEKEILMRIRQDIDVGLPPF
jgi:hypothetical protein